MFEPWMEADARERAWDQYRDRLPCCALCSRTIPNGAKIYTARGLNVCSDCKEELDYNWDIVEEDYDRTRIP